MSFSLGNDFYLEIALKIVSWQGLAPSPHLNGILGCFFAKWATVSFTGDGWFQFSWLN